MSSLQEPPGRPLAVDLFSGAGGLSLGLEQAGFDVVAAVEYDPVHAATHEFNFPLSEVLCADVSEPLQPNRLQDAVRAGLEKHGRDPQAWDGEIDLIAGGPPCQGFSLIGKRLVDDKRNALVFHFYRLVAELRPRYFLMENVPGMARGEHANILTRLIDEFENANFRFPEDKQSRVLNAADFGVPQERFRLFLLGTREDQPTTASYPSPTTQPVAKRPLESSSRHRSNLPVGPTVWDAIGDLPNINRFPSLNKSDEVCLSIETLAALSGDASAYARQLRNVDCDRGDFSYRRVWDPSVLTSSMRTAHTTESIRRFRSTRPGQTESVSRFYRLDPDGLCNTLRAGSGSERGAFTSPRPLHPYAARVLSNREAARIHSFPDWFRLHITKWHGFRQIGNAVAPLVARAVGTQIVDALKLNPETPKGKVFLGDIALLALNMREAAARYGIDKRRMPQPRLRGLQQTATRNGRKPKPAGRGSIPRIANSPSLAA